MKTYLPESRFATFIKHSYDLFNFKSENIDPNIFTPESYQKMRRELSANSSWNYEYITLETFPTYVEYCNGLCTDRSIRILSGMLGYSNSKTKINFAQVVEYCAASASFCRTD